MADEALALKFCLRRDEGVYNASISLPEVALEVEASNARFDDLVDSIVREVVSKLANMGYIATYDDVLSTLEQSIMQAALDIN